MQTDEISHLLSRDPLMCRTYDVVAKDSLLDIIVERNPGSFSFDIRHNCGRQTFADPQPLSSLLVLW